MKMNPNNPVLCPDCNIPLEYSQVVSFDLSGADQLICPKCVQYYMNFISDPNYYKKNENT